MESALCEAAVASRTGLKGQNNDFHTLEIKSLIAERRALKHNVSLSTSQLQERRKQLCKRIQGQTRRCLALRKAAKIQSIIEDFRGLKYIAGIKNGNARQGIAKIVNDVGITVTDQHDIAEVFATFYERLYSSTEVGVERAPFATSSAIEPFTANELILAIRKMKRGKCADESGIIAEMLKDGSSALCECLIDLFNDVLDPEKLPPDNWKRTKLVVIFKKGAPKLVKQNYRPIAILPILYTVFSRMVCDRILPALNRNQSAEQAAYRKDFSTEDHLISLTLLVEAAKEWNQPVWIGLVDFEKAFDTVEHEPLWSVLLDQGVEPGYVQLLRKLYAGQLAYVHAEACSRTFPLLRGVKQGDPISALLFIAVVEACMRTLKMKWYNANRRRKGPLFGLQVDGAEETLTNLRFADDLLLLAQSMSDVGKMLNHLQAEMRKYGLKLNADKTQTSCLWTNLRLCGK